MNIVVKVANDEYRIWDVSGPLPENYVCDAPTDPATLTALLEDLSEGSQDIIKAWVEE